MKFVLAFLNDYRDSIYYSALAVGTVCGLFYFPCLAVLGMAFNFIWGREQTRWFAWITACTPKEIIFMNVAGVVTVMANLLSFLFILAAGQMHGFSWFFLAINLIILFRQLYVLGFPSPRILFKVFVCQMWDWPRKQKPPEHRWDTARRKMRDALEKFRPDFIASPAGC